MTHLTPRQRPLIHFVYAVPPKEQLFSRRPLRGAEYQVRAAIDRMLPTRYRGGRTPTRRPLEAPYSITVNLMRALSEHADVMLYDWRERRSIDVGPRDIVLGHPHPDPSTIIQRTFREQVPCLQRVLIFPLHHGDPSINAYALPLLPAADLVLGIMGQHWFQTLGQSPFAKFQAKIVPLDMAIDVADYPYVKERFNPPGERGFLYIGSNRPEKGTRVLSESLALAKPARAGWIGSGPEIPHVTRISERVALTPELVRKIARDFDVFLNTSISDANPTTVLEAMAWGFPVGATKESGYVADTVIPLTVHDPAANAERLNELQVAPTERLMELSTTNRRLVETNFTWERFCTRVIDHLKID